MRVQLSFLLVRSRNLTLYHDSARALPTTVPMLTFEAALPLTLTKLEWREHKAKLSVLLIVRHPVSGLKNFHKLQVLSQTHRRTRV